MTKARDLVKEVERRDAAIVVLDPHRRSLARWVFMHAIALGMEKRIIFDRLSMLSRVPGYKFLEASKARDELDRQAENNERVLAFCELLCRRPGISGLATSPQKEEWTLWPLKLLISQDEEASPADLPVMFSPRARRYRHLLDHGQDEEAVEKIKGISTGVVKRGVYAAAERLIRGTFESPHFRVRCGGTFDLDAFLTDCGILIVEGGSTGNVSFDAMRVVLGSIAQKVIQFVRNRRKPFPRIHLVIDEAGNASLFGLYECRTIAETQKMGLDVTVMDQNAFSGNPIIQKAILQNCMRHEWFYCGDASLAKLAASDLRDSNLAAELMTLPRGVRWIKQHREVWKEHTKPLEDPWHFQGLGNSKAEQALRRIQKRPEYQSGRECIRTSDRLPGSIPAPSTTSSGFSPARQLRIEQSQQ